MPNNGRNGFEKYECDCDKVWIYRLNSSFWKIQHEVMKHTLKDIQIPIFDINASIQSKWGSWNPSTRIMTFSATLLRNYEWGAVEHVMRHEVAHQIVSEIFDMDCYGVAHGEAWARACKIVDIEPVRCDSHAFLAGFKGSESSPMVDKVRKIIIHANDKGASEAESETFMRKAKELMLRHDIEMTSVMGSDRVFVQRPFGKLFKRFPKYMWIIGNLLRDHYDVKHIRTYGPDCTKRLELFGEPDKLDIAEYVGHALLNQAEILYEIEKKRVSEAKAMKRLGRSSRSVNLGRLNRLDYLGHSVPLSNCDEYDNYRQTKLSKTAFIEGVVEGYSQKLSNDHDSAIERVATQVAKEQAEENGEDYHEGDRTLIPAYNEHLLKEMYNNAYPSMRNISLNSSRGAGWSEGRKAGRSLTLSKGVNGGNNKGRLLA